MNASEGLLSPSEAMEGKTVRFFVGIFNGLLYHASIMPTRINGPEEYHLEVYTQDWRGHKMPEFDYLYKTMEGAERALKRRYPDAHWRELE